MKRLDIKLNTLLNEQKLKTKWSELECHGASEFLSLLFQDQVQYGKLAHAIIVENRVVCMNLYEGVPYMSDGVSEMITKMYIDIEDNIILLSRSGNIYLYETEAMDASDLRHYYGKD
ncbi:MAG: hypothetical protein K0S75_351 [Clostridia bacterium]|jgi:hypothetical protein|nr:hypothetical protein [Clostridia bacterium]